MSSRKMRRALSLPLRADGNPDDINTVRKGVSEFWQRQPQNATAAVDFHALNAMLNLYDSEAASVEKDRRG